MHVTCKKLHIAMGKDQKKKWETREFVLGKLLMLSHFQRFFSGKLCCGGCCVVIHSLLCDLFISAYYVTSFESLQRKILNVTSFLFPHPFLYSCWKTDYDETMKDCLFSCWEAPRFSTVIKTTFSKQISIECDISEARTPALNQLHIRNHIHGVHYTISCGFVAFFISLLYYANILSLAMLCFLAFPSFYCCRWKCKVHMTYCTIIYSLFSLRFESRSLPL